MQRMWCNSEVIWKFFTVSLSCFSLGHGRSTSQIGHVDNKSSEVVSEPEAGGGILDVLQHSQNGRSFHIPVDHKERVPRTLADYGINFNDLMDDFSDYFMQVDELAEETQTCNLTSCVAPLNNQYMSFQQMEWYFEYLNHTFPDRVSVISIGKSVENRDIWMVHLKPEGCLNHARPDSIKSVWLEGGIHAREWISPAVCLHFIHILLHDCKLSQHFDIYILPEVNPDGYEYSRHNSSTRLWRKNRSLNEGSNCSGVDLNRNWDFQFGLMGTSDDPCSEIYMGEYAFSEPETYALSKQMAKVSNLELYISIHSYGQLLLYPYGFTLNETAPDTEAMVEACKIFVDALNGRFNNSFTCENSAEGLYFVGGANDDWAKGVLGVKYAYTLELRDMKDGLFGFLLPEYEITPSVEETWDGLQAMLKYMIEPLNVMEVDQPVLENTVEPDSIKKMASTTKSTTEAKAESSAMCACRSIVVMILGLFGSCLLIVL